MSRLHLSITIFVAASILVGAGLHAIVEIIDRGDVEGVFQGLRDGWLMGQLALLGTWVSIGPGLLFWRSARAILLILWMEIALVLADRTDLRVTLVATFWAPVFLAAGWFLLMSVVKRWIQGHRWVFVREASKQHWQMSLATAMTWLSEAAAILGVLSAAGLLNRLSFREFFGWSDWPDPLIAGVVIPIVLAPVVMSALTTRDRTFWFWICVAFLVALAAAIGSYEYFRPIPDFLEVTFRVEESYLLRCFGSPFGVVASLLVSVFGSVWIAHWLGYNCIRIGRDADASRVSAAYIE